jgi:hypothetical protein
MTGIAAPLASTGAACEDALGVIFLDFDCQTLFLEAKLNA